MAMNTDEVVIGDPKGKEKEDEGKNVYRVVELETRPANPEDEWVLVDGWMKEDKVYFNKLYYLINKGWWDAYTAWGQQQTDANPPIIDNSALLDSEKKVREDIVQDKDFICVNITVWDHLSAWYKTKDEHSTITRYITLGTGPKYPLSLEMNTVRYVLVFAGDKQSFLPSKDLKVETDVHFRLDTPLGVAFRALAGLRMIPPFKSELAVLEKNEIQWKVSKSDFRRPLSEIGIPDGSRITIYVIGTKLEQRGITTKKEQGPSEKQIQEMLAKRSEGTSTAPIQPGEGTSTGLGHGSVGVQPDPALTEEDELKKAIALSQIDSIKETVKTPGREDGDDMPGLVD